EQLKAEVEAEQAAQQEQKRAAARAAGYNLGVPVTINNDFNNLHWSYLLSDDYSDCVYSQAKIGDHLYLIKQEEKLNIFKKKITYVNQAKKPDTVQCIAYGLRATDDKIYAISYDYTYDGKTHHGVVVIPKGTYGGYDIETYISTGSHSVTTDSYNMHYYLGFEIDRAPDIRINQIYDLTDVYTYTGEFDYDACYKAYEYALSDFWDNVATLPLDIDRSYVFHEVSGIGSLGETLYSGRQIRQIFSNIDNYKPKISFLYNARDIADMLNHRYNNY
ncbi:MAG: hypothetical protein J6N55_04740, partial [Anaerovibrio sp.]|uniref:hypothetical protein n=1 Tax=Anaerovibrio sp. TaxID=1872532 RepID=UPI001B190295